MIRVVNNNRDEAFLSSLYSAKDIKSNDNVTLQFFIDDSLIYYADKLNKDIKNKDQLKYNNLII